MLGAEEESGQFGSQLMQHDNTKDISSSLTVGFISLRMWPCFAFFFVTPLSTWWTGKPQAAWLERKSHLSSLIWCRAAELVDVWMKASESQQVKCFHEASARCCAARLAQLPGLHRRSRGSEPSRHFLLNLQQNSLREEQNSWTGSLCARPHLVIIGMLPVVPST